MQHAARTRMQAAARRHLRAGIRQLGSVQLHPFSDAAAVGVRSKRNAATAAAAAAAASSRSYIHF